LGERRLETIEKDYEEFLELLNKHKVKYCVVGSYALALYAPPRYTKDMDVFMEPSRGNAKRMVLALHEFGFTQLKEKDLMEPGSIIQLGYEPIRIDIITSIDGCSFGQIWKTRKTGKYGKAKTYYMGIKELIRNKKATGRKQDIADLDVLKTIKKKKPRNSQRKL
jgi:hypothetical protein